MTNEEYNEDFGKVDWEEYENYENYNFGKVDWEEIELKVNWIRPDEGCCSKFILDEISYLRDSEDFLWTIKEGYADKIAGLYCGINDSIKELDEEYEIID
jgi:hypothetical protein